MDPEAVRRTLDPTASPEDISGSTPYDSFVISGVRLDAAEHGRVLCSFVVTPRHASPQGYLLSGVTATLADQMGSAVIYSIGVGLSEEGFSGVGLSGVSLEISVSYVDTATVGVRVRLQFLSLSNTYKGFRLMFLLIINSLWFMWAKMFCDKKKSDSDEISAHFVLGLGVTSLLRRWEQLIVRPPGFVLKNTSCSW
ncbi:hypothetical protein ACQ4PT_010048 [Festuca glaucescens]